ncbi:hypothetical protein [Nocardioides pacificus]
MLDQDLQDATLTRRPDVGDPWCDHTTRSLRRAQPPPASQQRPPTSEIRFWGYLALTGLLATLVPLTAALGARLVDSTGSRVLAGLAITLITALAVTASGAATDAAHETLRD